MGFSLILAGFFFLIVPTVNLLDIFPDFIGYIFIFAGLFRLKRIDSYMYKASHYALIMALVNLTKPVCLALCVTESTAAQSSNITTATLIYLVIELIFGILLVKNLFDGFSDIGFQYDDSSVKSRKKLLGRFYPKKKKADYEHSVHNKQSGEYKSLVERHGLHPVRYVALPQRKAIFKGVDGLYVFTVIFFAVRCVMTLIPELTTLGYTLTTYGTYEQSGDTGMRIMLMILCVFLGTVLGTAWYIACSKYIRGINRDGFFISRLKEAYRTKVTDNPDVMRSIEFSAYEKLLTAALVFGGDLFIDGFDVIPDIIPAALLFVALIMFRKHYKPFAVLSVFSGIYTAFCGFLLYIQISSVGTFYADTGLELPPMTALYGKLFPVSKAAFLILVVATLVMLIVYMKKNFTRAPLYSKGELVCGASIIALSQIGSAVGYFTDIISDELLRIPIKLGRVVWYANVYISFGSLIVYLIGMIVFISGCTLISNKLSGKE